MGLLSAAMLLAQVALTRIFSIAQFHHFGFLAVSLALLGFALAAGVANASAAAPVGITTGGELPQALISAAPTNSAAQTKSE